MIFHSLRRWPQQTTLAQAEERWAASLRLPPAPTPSSSLTHSAVLPDSPGEPSTEPDAKEVLTLAC